MLANSTLQSILNGQVRHLVSGAAGVLGTWGVIVPQDDQAKITAIIVSGVIYLLAAVLSAVQKKFQAEQVQTALMTPPPVPVVGK